MRPVNLPFLAPHSKSVVRRISADLTTDFERNELNTRDVFAVVTVVGCQEAP